MRLIVLLFFITFPTFAATPDLPPIFTQVATEYSVDYALLSKIADIESGFDVNAKAGTSSASGLFQIIRSTERWLRELCDITGDVFDPLTNTRMGACYINHNKKYLRRKLKREPNYTELYFSHFLGSYTAVKFLTQPEYLKVSRKLFGRALSSNRGVFFKKSGELKTYHEVKEYFRTKLEKARVLCRKNVKLSNSMGKSCSNDVGDVNN